MRARSLVVWAVAVALMAGAPGGRGNEKTADELRGMWIVVSSEKDGKAFDFPKKGTRLNFADGTVTVGTDKGKQQPLYSYSANAAKQPKEIDFVLLSGDKTDEKVILRGI